MSQKRTLSLKQQFEDRIISKFVDWVLGQKVDEGNISSMNWNKDEQDLIYKLVDNPKSAEINTSIRDPKFRRFFQSVAQNGLNTADVQMFYRYRDQLPIKQMNWAYDLGNFHLEEKTLKSTTSLHAGFYMLEVQIDLPRFQSRIPLEIETAYLTDKGTEINVVKLNATSGRISKRLLWLNLDSIVNIQAKNSMAIEHITHLRLSRLTRSFFTSRLMKKLGMQFSLTKHRALSDSVLQSWFQEYNELFAEITDLNQAYQHQIRHIESKTVPTVGRQVFNLSRWLK
jgi:hypothetical protein